MRSYRSAPKYLRRLTLTFYSSADKLYHTHKSHIQAGIKAVFVVQRRVSNLLRTCVRDRWRVVVWGDDHIVKVGLGEHGLEEWIGV